MTLSINGKKSTQIEDGVGTGAGVEAGERNEEKIPKARQRAKYDGKGNVLLKVGAYYRKDMYEEYRKIAFFRKINTYDLINDAMEAYLPELKKSQHHRLVEAGQQELLDR